MFNQSLYDSILQGLRQKKNIPRTKTEKVYYKDKNKILRTRMKQIFLPGQLESKKVKGQNKKPDILQRPKTYLNLKKLSIKI